ncbi:ATP-binding protein [Pedobacter psychroterrae]|uniref:histidine kinase n=1 Tax=Pedobacter psychroterrae TaxID=2530453 RepID=A0A4R0NMC0_9SPHI|nr:ATP-binding protein [Pedobacter psychroterrae]TCD00205.1 PAS domain S-box protein [Pedobacter psychroterrae]
MPTPELLSKDQLLEVYALTQTATAVHVGESAVIQTANNAMLKIWGKDKSVIGKSLEDALPELKGQPFIDMFKKVWNEGLTISGTDTAADLEVDGEIHTFYFDFEYRAIKDANEKILCILHTAIDVTDRVLREKAIALAHENEMALEKEQALNQELAAANEDLQQTKEKLAELNTELENKVNARVIALQQSNYKYQLLNEEFSALNEELATTIEELSASNEELLNSRQHLEEKIAELAASEGRFRSLISQAPMAICVIRASDLVVVEVNEGYLEIVGKSRKEIENKVIWEAVAEAAEGYAPLMQNVITTGVAFLANEHEVVLVRNGNHEIVFLDFVYEPVKSQEGIVTSIMVVVIDVTEKVTARRSIEDVEERVRLAVDAAEIGTFDYNYLTNTMVTSDRFNAIFGVQEFSSRDEYLKVFHPDDIHLSAEAHERARQTGKMLYEARLIHPDGSIHWMRVQANVYYDEKQNPVRLLGTILDITEFKRLQQQKDDFISIASHELKTPITALKASLQLLDRMKDKPASSMLPRLIEQSNRSMGKISELVEDLLNVSRMNEGQIKLTKKRFVLSHTLNECCSHVRIGGKHELVFQGDADLEVVADEHRIDQVIVNLVNNAVKYAPNSKQIYLIVENLGDMVRVSVKDTGMGISAEKLPHLFNRYYRVDDSGYQVSGLGLGLYISADIIERHGGEIGVDSEEGKGSTFWFTLPL